MADGFAPLSFTPEVEAATLPLWEKVSKRVTPIEWRLHAGQRHRAADDDLVVGGFCRRAEQQQSGCGA